MPIIRLPGEAGEEGGVDFHVAPEVAEAGGQNWLPGGVTFVMFTMTAARVAW